MKRDEHLLLIIAEECAEVAQSVSKAIRFGLGDSEPGQEFTNRERIWHEMCDLFAVYEMACLPLLESERSRARMVNKAIKVEKYLEYSQQCGTLEIE